MDKQDTLFIKIQGKANIAEPLEIDHNYKIEADCSITQIRRDSNENGEYNITYKAEPIHVWITKNNGKIISAKDPRRVSEKFRKMCFKEWESSRANVLDFQEVYEQVGYVAMSEMPRLVEEAVKRLEK